MKIIFFLFCSIVSIHGELLQLASNNISKYLQNHVTFVKFYSHWFRKSFVFFSRLKRTNVFLWVHYFRCPHSKRFESVWKQFAANKYQSGVVVARVRFLFHSYQSFDCFVNFLFNCSSFIAREIFLCQT